MSTRTLSSFLLAALLVTSGARADDDPMAPYRDRFRAGMDRYKADDIAGAIASWEPILRDVGPEKGYRVAFDLARAYEKLGEQPLAIEDYRAFLRGVDGRRARGEAIEPVVAKEETDARARLAEIAPAVPAEEVPPATPSPATTQAPPPETSPVVVAPTPRWTTTQHPFSPWVLVAGGVATAGVGIVCAVEYARALSTKSDFAAASNQPTATQGAIRDSYEGIRPVAYGALGATVGLAAITGALTAWYVAGTKSRAAETMPIVTAAPIAHGGQIAIAARF